MSSPRERMNAALQEACEAAQETAVVESEEAASIVREALDEKLVELDMKDDVEEPSDDGDDEEEE